MEVTFVAAVLVAAVIACDRLDGAEELVRLLYQVALAASLAFATLSGTLAFVRQDYSQAALTNPNTQGDVANRIATSAGVDFAVGAILVVTGIALMRRYRTVALGVVLGGVFLVVTATAGGVTIGSLSLLQTGASQKVALVVFAVAVAGTIALSSYGLRLDAQDADGGNGGGAADGATP